MSFSNLGLMFKVDKNKLNPEIIIPKHLKGKNKIVLTDIYSINRGYFRQQYKLVIYTDSKKVRLVKI